MAQTGAGTNQPLRSLKGDPRVINKGATDINNLEVLVTHCLWRTGKLLGMESAMLCSFHKAIMQRNNRPRDHREKMLNLQLRDWTGTEIAVLLEDYDSRLRQSTNYAKTVDYMSAMMSAMCVDQTIMAQRNRFTNLLDTLFLTNNTNIYHDDRVMAAIMVTSDLASKALFPDHNKAQSLDLIFWATVHISFTIVDKMKTVGQWLYNEWTKVYAKITDSSRPIDILASTTDVPDLDQTELPNKKYRIIASLDIGPQTEFVKAPTLRKMLSTQAIAGSSASTAISGARNVTVDAVIDTPVQLVGFDSRGIKAYKNTVVSLNIATQQLRHVLTLSEYLKRLVREDVFIASPSAMNLFLAFMDQTVALVGKHHLSWKEFLKCRKTGNFDQSTGTIMGEAVNMIGNRVRQTKEFTKLIDAMLNDMTTLNPKNRTTVFENHMKNLVTKYIVPHGGVLTFDRMITALLTTTEITTICIIVKHYDVASCVLNGGVASLTGHPMHPDISKSWNAIPCHIDEFMERTRYDVSEDTSSLITTRPFALTSFSSNFTSTAPSAAITSATMTSAAATVSDGSAPSTSAASSAVAPSTGDADASTSSITVTPHAVLSKTTQILYAYFFIHRLANKKIQLSETWVKLTKKLNALLDKDSIAIAKVIAEFEDKVSGMAECKQAKDFFLRKLKQTPARTAEKNTFKFMGIALASFMPRDQVVLYDRMLMFLIAVNHAINKRLNLQFIIPTSAWSFHESAAAVLESPRWGKMVTSGWAKLITRRDELLNRDRFDLWVNPTAGLVHIPQNPIIVAFQDMLTIAYPDGCFSAVADANPDNPQNADGESMERRSTDKYLAIVDQPKPTTDPQAAMQTSDQSNLQTDGQSVLQADNQIVQQTDQLSTVATDGQTSAQTGNQAPGQTDDQSTVATDGQAPAQTGNQAKGQTYDQSTVITSGQAPAQTGNQSTGQTDDQSTMVTGGQAPSQTGNQAPGQTDDHPPHQPGGQPAVSMDVELGMQSDEANAQPSDEVVLPTSDRAIPQENGQNSQQQVSTESSAQSCAQPQTQLVIYQYIFINRIDKSLEGDAEWKEISNNMHTYIDEASKLAAEVMVEYGNLLSATKEYKEFFGRFRMAIDGSTNKVATFKRLMINYVLQADQAIVYDRIMAVALIASDLVNLKAKKGGQNCLETMHGYYLWALDVLALSPHRVNIVTAGWIELDEIRFALLNRATFDIPTTAASQPKVPIQEKNFQPKPCIERHTRYPEDVRVVLVNPQTVLVLFAFIFKNRIKVSIKGSPEWAALTNNLEDYVDDISQRIAKAMTVFAGKLADTSLYRRFAEVADNSLAKAEVNNKLKDEFKTLFRKHVLPDNEVIIFDQIMTLIIYASDCVNRCAETKPDALKKMFEYFQWTIDLLKFTPKRTAIVEAGWAEIEATIDIQPKDRFYDLLYDYSLLGDNSPSSPPGVHLAVDVNYTNQIAPCMSDLNTVEIVGHVAMKGESKSSSRLKRPSDSSLTEDDKSPAKSRKS